MQRKLFLASLVFAVSILAFGCLENPEKEANKLFVETTSLAQSIKNNSKNYSEALEIYTKAKSQLDSILKKYSTTDVAVKLITEQAKISGLSLKEFEHLHQKLVSLALAEKDSLACALFLSSFIKDNEDKQKALQSILAVLLEQNRYAEVMQSIPSISDPEIISSFYYQLALKYADVGDAQRILELIRFKIPEQSNINLREVVSIMLKKGFIDQATLIANTITDSFYNNLALIEIANKHIELGRKEIGIELLFKVIDKNKVNTTNVLGYICQSLAKAGLIDKALDSISTATDPHNKTQYLESIAESCIPNNKEQALGILSKALETADLIAPGFPQDYCMLSIANLYLELDEASAALKIFDVIPSATGKVDVLVEIAKYFSKKNEKDKATQLLSEAFELAQNIDDSYSRFLSLKNVSYGFIQLGAYTQAANVIDRIKDAPIVVDCLLEIASQSLVVAPQTFNQEKVLSLALDFTKDYEDHVSKAFALLEIARSFIKIGEKERAIEVLSIALESTQRIDEFDENKFDSKVNIAVLFAELDCFEKSLQVAEGSIDILCSIAHYYSKTGDKAKREKICDLIMQEAINRKDLSFQIATLRSLSSFEKENVASFSAFLQKIVVGAQPFEKLW